MLVDERVGDSAELVGYLSPFPDESGFVLPLFKRKGGNGLSVQEISNDDMVTGFRELVPRDVHTVLMQEPVLIDIGDQALWGFVDSTGQQHFERRNDLKVRLKMLLDAVEQPFLRLQIAQFCENEDDLVETWRSSFKHIANRSVSSAEAWRDLVIIPANVRAAVKQTVLTHGLDGSLTDLGRSVEVDLKNGVINLRLASDLYWAFNASPAARKMLFRMTVPMHKAFDLIGGEIFFTRIHNKVGSTAEAVRGEQPSVAVVAFGHMATGIMKSVFREALWSKRQRSSGSYSTFPVETEKFMVFHDRELIAQGNLTASEHLNSVTINSNVILVVFQVAETKPHLVEAALNFTTRHDDIKGRRLVAVIPHFPDFAFMGKGIGKNTLSMIEKCFDAVWILGDRSPYTRHSLPYGPSRSVQAVSSHFSYLMASNGGPQDNWDASFENLGINTNLCMVSSAVGEQSIPRLVEHALMRLTHYGLDFSKAPSVSVAVGNSSATIGRSVVDTINRAMPIAKVDIAEGLRIDGGPQKVTLAVRGVFGPPDWSESFERFCGEQLSKHGWEVRSSPSENGDMIASLKNFRELPIECKFYTASIKETALRVRFRRRREVDTVLITNARILRSFFACSVLNGVLPIHYSRIERLVGIYRRRYAYVLRTQSGQI
jgi:hypothetical protein